MVVFKHKRDRDSWYNGSITLKQMISQGVSLSTVWYSRDLDKVVSEGEKREIMMGVRGRKGREGVVGGGIYLKLLEERDRNAKTEGEILPSSKLNVSALSAEIKDLDKLSNSLTSNAPVKVGISTFKLSIPDITDLIPPVRTKSSKSPLASRFDLPIVKSSSSKVERSTFEV